MLVILTPDSAVTRTITTYTSAKEISTSASARRKTAYIGGK